MDSRSTTFVRRALHALLRPTLVCLGVAALVAAVPAHAAPAAGPFDPMQPLRALLAVQQAHLTAADGAAHDYFGCSVAISGDTAVVGAIGADDWNYQGSVYVFVRSGATWSQQARLTATDRAADDFFGCSVAIAGDTAVVGAYRDDIGSNANQGSVYVFVRSGTTWSQQAHLTADDGTAGDYFGYSVAISGDTAVVGPQQDSIGTNAGQGSAYVFTRSGTAWSQQAKLTAADGAAWDQFGYSVAISGDTAVVGAVSDDVGGNAYQGSAYVFVRSGTTWSQQAKLTAAGGAAWDQFGISVAISGDTAVAGVIFDQVGANFHQGSACVFTRSGTTWGQQAMLTAADGAPEDCFGYSVAIAGETAVAGAYFDDVGTGIDRGSAYVFVPASPPPVAITVTAGANGTITPGSGPVMYGSSPTYAITPDPGYHIDSLTADGVAQTPQSSWTFVNVIAPHSVAATFAVDVNPSIASLTPTAGRIGSLVTIAGADFGDAQGTVTFGGVPAGVTNWTATQAVCKVPAAISGKVDVVLTTAAGLASPPVSFSVRPKIGSLSPVRGKVGITVTITGTGFGAVRGTSKVYFGSKAATRYVSWSATKIKVKVPRVTKGRKAVKVKTAGGTSNIKYFARI